MFTLSLCTTGTVDVARSQHETLADAHHALARFARAYDIQGYGTESGTLTTKCGRVNQASYTWSIRPTRVHTNTRAEDIALSRQLFGK